MGSNASKSVVAFALSLSTVLPGQRVDIWREPFTSSLSSDWNEYKNPEIVTDNNCPTESSCLEIGGEAKEEVWRFDSSEGYSNVQLTFDLQTESADQCEIFIVPYETGDTWDGWSLLQTDAFVSEGTSTTYTRDLPNEYDNVAALGVALYTGDSGYCRFNNMALTGEIPTNAPTPVPTPQPTKRPTAKPTKNPTENPTKNPTESPSKSPSPQPTPIPSESPSDNPTPWPTPIPSPSPTQTPQPTYLPSFDPTANPTKTPTHSPSVDPTSSPTKIPTQNPSQSPTTNEPTTRPTEHELEENIIAIDLEIDDDSTAANDPDTNNDEGSIASKSINTETSDIPLAFFFIVGGCSVVCCICTLLFLCACDRRRTKKKTFRPKAMTADEIMIVASASSSPASDYVENWRGVPKQGIQQGFQQGFGASAGSSMYMDSARSANNSIGVMGMTHEGPQSPDSMQMLMMETNGAVQGAVPMDDSDDEELDIIRDIETVQGPDEVVLIQHDKYGLDTRMVRDVVQLDVESEHSISNDMDVDQLQNGVQLEHEGDDDLVREINGVSISTMDG